MKQKKYPTYKPSGVEWIGDIPEHWTLQRFKYFTTLKNGYAFKSEKYVEDGVPVIRIGDIASPVNLDEAKKILPEEAEELKEFIITKGDVLVALTGATIGKSCVYMLDETALLNQRVGLVKPTEKATTAFLAFLISSDLFIRYIDIECFGGAQENIGKEQLGGFEFPLPPVDEQNSISTYLDEKTALIDSTIRKKEKLIELLQEERTAIINQAVTRGLDPNVKMKESGVEWLGEIPEHWELIKLKFISHIKYGLGQPPKYKEDGLPLLRATNVYRGDIDENDLVFVDPDDIPWDRDPVLKANDIIVVRSGAYTADSAIIPDRYDGAIAGYDMVVRVLKANPAFIALSLLSEKVLLAQLYQHRIRAAQPHLNREELGETFFCIPPAYEQEDIVKKVSTERASINKKILKVREEISLLQEYRTALINEVVTGKRCVI